MADAVASSIWLRLGGTGTGAINVGYIWSQEHRHSQPPVSPNSLDASPVLRLSEKPREPRQGKS